MLNMSGTFVIPEGTFVLAASLRWLAVAMMVGFVVRDILHPELDVVRRTYGDDPDGGDFERAPDSGYEVLSSAYASLRRTILSLVGSPRSGVAEDERTPGRVNS
jgi:hypothetical protein